MATEHSHNEVVGYYLGAVCCVLRDHIGLARGRDMADLLGRGNRVGEEAAAVGALYRDVSSFPDPNRTELQSDLRQYARQVIDVAWPQQRRGIVPEERRRHAERSSDAPEPI